MQLGQRLRQARLEAGLSQRQLCGNEITRNMLSLIENGSAQPSIHSLRYFAEKLQKPVSYFLEEEIVISPNQNILKKARKSYEQGNYPATASLLEDYRKGDALFDPEEWLLEALTAIALAKQAIAAEKLPFALHLLESAATAGAHTIYYTPELERQRLLLLSQAAPEQIPQISLQLSEDDRELFVRAAAALKSGDTERCFVLLDAAENHEDMHWCFLRAEAYLSCRQYRQAVKFYRKSEDNFPGKVWPKLELCYRELQDFKMAYVYACKQR